MTNAGLLGNPGPSPATTPALVTRLDGTRTVAVGDSLTAADSSGDRNFFNSWITHLAAMSQGAIRPVYMAAHGGYTSQQLQALAMTEIWANSPTLVIMQPGRNDSDLGVDVCPPETMRYVRAVYTECRRRGVGFVLVNQTPQGVPALPTPTGLTATPSTTGGTLAAATYRYRLTALGGLGETDGSTVATGIVASGSTGSVRLDWPHMAGRSSYKLYRESTPGSGTYGLIQTLSTGANGLEPNLSYTDTGATPTTTIPATNTSGAVLITGVGGIQKLHSINLALAKFAEQEGVLLADVYTPLSTPAGTYAANLSIDGTHPTRAGTRVAASAIWATISSSVRTPAPLLARTNVDSQNRMGNGLLLNGSGGIPTGWTNSTNTGTGFNAPILAAKTGFRGQAFTMELTDGATVQEYQTQATSIEAGQSWTGVPGDLIGFSYRFQVEGADTGGGGYYIAVTDQSNFTLYVTGWSCTDSAGATPGLVSGVGRAVNNSTFKFVLRLRNGPIKVSIGELAIVNLTRLQLDKTVPALDLSRA